MVLATSPASHRQFANENNSHLRLEKVPISFVSCREQTRAGDGKAMHFTQTEACYSFSNLTEPGRIVVSAMRSAPSGAAATLSCFIDSFGERRGRPCFVVFLQIVHALALFGRRRMRVGRVGWPVLTHDEVAFLRCVDAAVRGEGAAFEAHLVWLVRRPGVGAFAGYIRTLAGLLPEPPLGGAVPVGREGRRAGAAAVVRTEKRPAPKWSASASPVAAD